MGTLFARCDEIGNVARGGDDATKGGGSAVEDPEDALSVRMGSATGAAIGLFCELAVGRPSPEAVRTRSGREETYCPPR
ncbi:MAG: hypothetical protein KBF88_02715 [Polyangiaceae bacterium]|nr:hypothetical protein [Polyangiaceae bacterium]